MGAKSIKKSGFTIVELLIVIVVIGILAAITIVAYNGVQTRTKNTKTVAAVEAWVKAINLYKVDNGDYPTQNSCLGQITTYPSNRCASLYGWTVVSAFTDSLSKYLGGQLTEPDITEGGYNSSDKYRGAFYIAGTPPQLLFMQTNSSNCPTVGGLQWFESTAFLDGSVYCRNYVN